MTTIPEILQAYLGMRTQGVDAKRALEILRPQINTFSQQEQVEIVRQVRQAEVEYGQRKMDSRPTPSVTKPQIKPISQKLPKLEGKAPNKMAQTLPVDNAASEYADYQGVVNTRKLNDDGHSRDSFFGSESMLVLAIRGSNISFKLRPQRHSHALVLGRGDVSSTPDIDLTEFGAASLGVSRAHVSLQYDRSSATLTVTDLNTVNGTFINGVKLLPQEVRVLRHGDEIRLGQLVMIAHFYFAEN